MESTRVPGPRGLRPAPPCRRASPSSWRREALRVKARSHALERQAELAARPDWDATDPQAQSRVCSTEGTRHNELFAPILLPRVSEGCLKYSAAFRRSTCGTNT